MEQDLVLDLVPEPTIAPSPLVNYELTLEVNSLTLDDEEVLS